MMQSISVVIPTYNGAAYVEEALASVFAQTLPPANVIVVDDCSTDGTAALAARIGRSAPLPVRVVRLSENSGGPAAPINAGIAAERTEYITVLDQDDVFAPDKIEQQAILLAEHPDVAVAAGLCSPWNEPRSIHSWQLDLFRQLGGTNSEQAIKLSGRDSLRALMLHGNFLVGYPSFMFRTADWRAKGGADERYRVASDYDLLCWLCSRGSMAITPGTHYVRRTHDSNVCNNKQRMFLDVAQVRHYLTSQRWLLADEEISRPMRDWFGYFGYCLREAGNYETPGDATAPSGASGAGTVHWRWSPYICPSVASGAGWSDGRRPIAPSRTLASQTSRARRRVGGLT